MKIIFILTLLIIGLTLLFASVFSLVKIVLERKELQKSFKIDYQISRYLDIGTSFSIIGSILGSLLILVSLISLVSLAWLIVDNFKKRKERNMKKIYTKEVHYGYIIIDDNLSDEEQEEAIREEINNGCEHIDNFEYSFSEKKEELNELTYYELELLTSEMSSTIQSRYMSLDDAKKALKGVTGWSGSSGTINKVTIIPNEDGTIQYHREFNILKYMQ